MVSQTMTHDEFVKLSASTRTTPASARPARRTHFLAQCYLKNFADPIFSENLHYYDIKKHAWELKPRTPYGVGWVPYLTTLFDAAGKRDDRFERFLKERVEDPVAPVLKKLARHERVNNNERADLARFIAVTVAINPENQADAFADRFWEVNPAKKSEQDAEVAEWCRRIGRKFDDRAHAEYFKGIGFNGLWRWALSLRDRLMQWEWKLLGTSRANPFITSDRPVFLWRDPQRDVQFVSFPISSEMGLVVVSRFGFRDGLDPQKEIAELNRQTMLKATRFVVSCQRHFSGDTTLPSLPIRE